MPTLTGILLTMFYSVCFAGFVYVVSRIQMKAWLKELRSFLHSELEVYTINKNENETEEKE